MCDLTTEPAHRACTNVNHWYRWLVIVVLEVQRDMGDLVGEGDIFHDCAQNLMWDMPAKIVAKFSRITGVPPEPHFDRQRTAHL